MQNQQSIFYATFNCGKHVHEAEQLTKDYNDDLQKFGNENAVIVGGIAACYNLAASEANRAGWDKEIDFKNEAATWQAKYDELTKDSRKPIDFPPIGDLSCNVCGALDDCNCK